MKNGMAILMLVVFLAVMVWLGYAIIASPAAPDPETSEPEEVQKFIASDGFKKMSTEEKTEYMQQYRERLRDVPREERRQMYRSENLSDKERRSLRQNMGEVRREQMLTEAQAFFKMSPAEQDAFLDKRLDDMAARRKGWAERRKGAGKSGQKSRSDRRGKGEGHRGPWGRGNRNADQIQKRMQQRLSDRDPEERAIISEYWRRFHERMMQRRAQRN